MQARSYARPAAGLGLSRPPSLKIAVALLLAALIGGIFLLGFRGKPTPTVAGLRQIPASALRELEIRLGADGRPVSTSSPGPVGTLTRSLTGAALLSSGRDSLRFEVSTQYYFPLKDKPPKGGGPASWDGLSENYRVAVSRTSAGNWRLKSVKLIPLPSVGEG